MYIRHRAYQLPDPMRTYEEWQQSQNLDIAGMTSCEIDNEEFRCRAALANMGETEYYVRTDYDTLARADEWFRQRLARLRCEKRQRKWRK